MTDSTEQILARLDCAVAQLALLADELRRQPAFAEIVLEDRKDCARQPGHTEVVPPSDLIATEIDSQDLPPLEPKIHRARPDHPWALFYLRHSWPGAPWSLARNRSRDRLVAIEGATRDGHLT